MTSRKAAKAESGRTGFTTGACAAVAAKAAALALLRDETPLRVEVRFPDGSRNALPVEFRERAAHTARAGVRKDAGDDPDVTDGKIVCAEIEVIDGPDVLFTAGEGVGTVTKPGLALPPGEPAINPAPRAMIRDAVREVTDLGVRVTISIPGGRELADKTFNPRLGVVGGLSILGTSGIVRPFSNTALRDALKCSVDVAHACGIEYPVLTPGRIGEKAARARFRLTPQQIIEAGNEWGFILDECARAHFRAALVVGHAGKLAKLIGGHWDTHSSRSPSALPIVTRIYEEQFGASAPESVTVEGLFGALPPTERSALAVHVAEGVAKAVKQRLGQDIPISVMLVNLQGRELGVYGDVSQWAILESQS